METKLAINVFKSAFLAVFSMEWNELLVFLWEGEAVRLLPNQCVVSRAAANP